MSVVTLFHEIPFKIEVNAKIIENGWNRVRRGGENP